MFFYFLSGEKRFVLCFLNSFFFRRRGRCHPIFLPCPKLSLAWGQPLFSLNRTPLAGLEGGTQ